MIRLAISVLLLLVAVALRWAGRDSNDQPTKLDSAELGRDQDERLRLLTETTSPANTRSFALASWSALALAVAFAGWSAVRVVPAQHTAVQVRFGETIDTHGDGLMFVLPWDTLHNYSLRTQTLENSNADGAVSGPIAGRAADASTFETDAIIRYAIDSDQALRVFDEYGIDRSAFEAEVINADFRSVVRQVMAQTEVLDLDTNRTQMEAEICALLNERWADIAVCRSAVLRNIDIDNDVEAQAEAVNIARQRAEEAVFQLERTETLARGEVLEAAATVDAQAILECGYELDGAGNPVPLDRNNCQAVLTDRGLFVRCLATVDGTAEGAQPNQHLFPLDCTSILTGQTSAIGADIEVLVAPTP